MKRSELERKKQIAWQLFYHYDMKMTEIALLPFMKVDVSTVSRWIKEVDGRQKLREDTV